ncbi:hypothetical protein HPP92_016862 [Vanilla planifolia]|uniref:Uncharacterized protein n=1 Tax=Vanilla planifolia TaxID=51239 RepID=A0A835QJN9_VANPL|nr:hypothetical protein HPP92_016862 [Vanilla planifolia]
MKRLEHLFVVFVLCHLLLLVYFPWFALSQSSTSCPLNFTLAKPYVSAATSSHPSDLCAFSFRSSTSSNHSTSSPPISSFPIAILLFLLVRSLFLLSPSYLPIPCPSPPPAVSPLPPSLFRA